MSRNLVQNSTPFVAEDRAIVAMLRTASRVVGDITDSGMALYLARLAELHAAARGKQRLDLLDDKHDAPSVAD